MIISKAPYTETKTSTKGTYPIPFPIKIRRISQIGNLQTMKAI